MAHVLPQEVDTVVIGNGPSALLLSYILHGNIPTYDTQNPHPDPILHEKLRDCEDLLNPDIEHLTNHFAASRFSYSTQALPINVLFDTLIRPFGETDNDEQKSCITWKHDRQRTVSHVVLGKTPRAGGQWVDNPVDASWDIGTLSYAGMLALPGYSFEKHHRKKYDQALPFFSRPSRREVADYFAAYPFEVGISDSVFNDHKAYGISRRGSEFHIESHGIICKHLVLASGVFDELIPPRPLLRPLLNLSPGDKETSPSTVLIIGSGFSAADVILSTPPSCKIIHIFKWNPAVSPSPLRACHQQAYPDYAGIYRKMKIAAASSKLSRDKRPRNRRTSSSTLDLSRDWSSSYEGLPNTLVVDVQVNANAAIVTLQNEGEELFERQVHRLVCVVGRRGSLEYLEPPLRDELCPSASKQPMISGQTMREAANCDLEVTDGVFIIGSLTGDSLIRFAYGGCTYIAGKILPKKPRNALSNDTSKEYQEYNKISTASHTDSPQIPAMHGLDGHVLSPMATNLEGETPLDRRKRPQPTSTCVTSCCE